LTREATRSRYKGAPCGALFARAFTALTILAILAVVRPPFVSAQSHANGTPKKEADAASSVTPVKTYGLKTAPITIEVFSDYECPACGNFYRTTLRTLINEYVPAGKVYLVHRDFPLPMHPYSYQAARWANAAAKIGRFPDVEGALFDNQATWSVDGNIQKIVAAALSKRDFVRLQKLMAGCEPPSPPSVKPASATTRQTPNQGCAVDTFINQDVALGKQIPVSQTPTFVIYNKGQKISTVPGQISWDILRKFIDSLLAQ